MGFGLLGAPQYGGMLDPNSFGQPAFGGANDPVAQQFVQADQAMPTPAPTFADKLSGMFHNPNTMAYLGKLGMNLMANGGWRNTPVSPLSDLGKSMQETQQSIMQQRQLAMEQLAKQATMQKDMADASKTNMETQGLLPYQQAQMALEQQKWALGQGPEAYKAASAENANLLDRTKDYRQYFDSAKMLYDMTGGDAGVTPIHGVDNIGAVKAYLSAIQQNPRAVEGVEDVQSAVDNLSDAIKSITNNKELSPELTAQLRNISIRMMQAHSQHIRDIVGQRQQLFSQSMPMYGGQLSPIVTMGFQQYMDPRWSGLRGVNESAYAPQPTPPVPAGALPQSAGGLLGGR